MHVGPLKTCLAQFHEQKKKGAVWTLSGPSPGSTVGGPFEWAQGHGAKQDRPVTI